jgi:hypothetical protein
MKRGLMVGMVLGLLAVLLATTTPGCASREQIEQGLQTAQDESAWLDGELDRYQAVLDAVNADLANFEPGTPEHAELSKVLRETQRAMNDVRSIKGGVDERIEGYLAELAQIPEDAPDWQVSGRLTGKVLKDESKELPHPWNWIAYGVGSAVMAVSTVGWARTRRAVYEIVGGVEDGKRYNPDLADEMDAASPYIRAGQSASTKAIVSKVRHKLGAAKPKPVAEG